MRFAGKFPQMLRACTPTTHLHRCIVVEGYIHIRSKVSHFSTKYHYMDVVIQSGGQVNLFVSFSASLFSLMDSAFRASITVDHLYGLVASLFHVVNTEEKLSWSIVDVKQFSLSLLISSWIPTSLHLLGIWAATSFIRSESFGSASNPAGYLLLRSEYMGRETNIINV